MFRLCTWAKENADSLKGLKMAQIAAKASAAMEFPVGVANVHAVQAAIGVKFNPRPEKVKAAATIADLAREVIRLREKCGEDIDDDLRKQAGVLV